MNKGALAQKMKVLRALAFMRQGGLCWWCGTRMKTPPECSDPNDPAACSADHLRKRANGGQHTEENVVAACRRCNTTRHAFGGDKPRIRIRAVSIRVEFTDA